MTSSTSTNTAAMTAAAATEAQRDPSQGLPEQREESATTTTTTATGETTNSRAKQAKPYEELMIKDGPIYNWTTKAKSNTTTTTKPDESSTIASEDDFNFSTPTGSSSCTPSPPLPAESTALLIVDVQPEYWSNCPPVREDFPDFPKNLKKTIDICRQRRAKIIWVRADYRHKHSPWLSQFERMRGPRNLGEVPCDPSSPEFTWEEFATPEGGEVIIAKSSWSSTSNTALVDILKLACIETVLVCGLITSVCVQHSAFGIFEAGYRTLLVTDACADRGRARHEAALALYGDYMYELVTSEDLESKTKGLIPAEPVWVVLDHKTNMIRANSFPKQVVAMATSTSTNTVSTVSSSRMGEDDDDDDEDQATTTSTISAFGSGGGGGCGSNGNGNGPTKHQQHMLGGGGDKHQSLFLMVPGQQV